MTESAGEKKGDKAEAREEEEGERWEVGSGSELVGLVEGERS